MNEKVIQILKKIGIVLLLILSYLVVLLSMLPLVGWWAGLISLVASGALFFLIFIVRKERGQNPLLLRFLRLSVYGVICGVFLHLCCGFYSSYRVNRLDKECSEEKKAVFDSLSVKPAPNADSELPGNK